MNLTIQARMLLFEQTTAAPPARKRYDCYEYSEISLLLCWELRIFLFPENGYFYKII